MASHHHHCHQPAAPAPNPTPCYSHCCDPTYTPCHHHHHHPPAPPDSHLHHPPNQPHFYTPQSHLPNLPQYPTHFQEHYFREETQPHPKISYLLRRIATLESSLSRRRASHAPSSQSLRDAAARTIQSHFRAFLLHRSITLRQLKDLASIKSTLGVLKSSVSEKTHFDYGAVYHKAANLLLKLDAIQGGDPMIRNGKSSLSRELNRFLDFLEGDFVQRRALSKVRQSSSNVKSRVLNDDREIRNVESGCLKRVNMEKLRGLGERIDRLAEEIDEEESGEINNPVNEFMIRNLDVSPNRTRGLLKNHGGVQPKVKKNVSFVEDGKVYRVLRRRSNPYLEECNNGSVDRGDLVNCDEKELEDDLCREIGEIGVSQKEDVEEDEEGSLLSSDGEKETRRYSTSEGNFETTMQDQDDIDNDDFIFSAPLLVKMETRGNLIDKRKKFNNILGSFG